MAARQSSARTSRRLTRHWANRLLAHWANRLLIALAAAAFVTACQTGPIGLRSFGSMREVMREGHDQARVSLAQFGTKDTIGVGALANLFGEITIVDGQVLVATVQNGVPTVRAATCGDSATLLLAEDVRDWQDFPVGACASYEQLEQRIAKLLRAHGHDVLSPTPVRVRGTVTRLQVHVIAGACPIATPAGPKPWRYDGPADNVQLIGFYVEGAAGKWTHHTHQSHLHAVSDQAMGHLDGVVLTDAIVSLPARAGATRAASPADGDPRPQ